MVTGWLNELLHSEDDLSDFERKQEEDFPFLKGQEPETYEAPDLDLASRLMEEEIASLRYVLRNALVLALEERDFAVYTRLVQLYGGGSVRLARLLKREKNILGCLKSDAYYDEMDQWYMDTMKAWGWEIPEGGISYTRMMKIRR